MAADSAWPVDVACEFKPKAVLIAEVRDVDNNVSVYYQGLDWEWIEKVEFGVNKQFVRIKDIAGLPAAKYKIRLLFIAD